MNYFEDIEQDARMGGFTAVDLAYDVINILIDFKVPMGVNMSTNWKMCRRGNVSPLISFLAEKRMNIV